MFEWFRRALHGRDVPTQTVVACGERGDRFLFRGALIEILSVKHGKVKFAIVSDEYEIRKIPLESVRPIGEDAR